MGMLVLYKGFVIFCQMAYFIDDDHDLLDVLELQDYDYAFMAASEVIYY